MDAKKQVIDAGLLGEVGHAEICCYYHMRSRTPVEKALADGRLVRAQDSLVLRVEGHDDREMERTGALREQPLSVPHWRLRNSLQML